MTDDENGGFSSSRNGFPVPIIGRSFRKLLLPGESFDDVFDKLDFAVDPVEENSIWSRKKMTTTVSKPSVTIDKFFPKLFKKEPPDYGIKQEPINPDSSESEYEMVHENKLANRNPRSSKKKSNSPKATTGSDRSYKDQSVNREPSNDSDSNNELSLFHSTAIGKLHDRVPLNVEESGIGPGDSDTSDSERVIERFANKSREPNSIDIQNKPLIGTGDKFKSTMEKKNIIKSDLNQNSKSEKFDKDMSNSSDEETSGAPSDDQAKDVLLLRNMTQTHTLSDDEVIPSSQDMKGYLNLSLGPGDKTFSKETVRSVLNSRKSSNLSEFKNKSLLETSSSEPLPPNDHETSLIEQLKKKLTDVRTMSEADKKDSLFAEDLSEDVEVYIIQCPKDVDPASLVGQDLLVEGNSVISLSKDGKSDLYDSFAIKDDFGRSLNLLLPGKEDQKIKLGAFPLSGNIILTKCTEQPQLIVPEVESFKKVEFPAGLEEICSSISEVADASFSDSAMALNNSECTPRKKKKKKKREQDEAEPMEEEISCEPVEVEPKRKKKRKHYESEDMFSSGRQSDNDSLQHSFEKKRRKLEDGFIVPSEFQSPPIKIKKEKISPFKSGFSELRETFNETTTGDLVETLKKKKKKKKSHDYDKTLDEINCLSPRNIKKELNVSQSFSPVLDSEVVVSDVRDTFNETTAGDLMDTLKRKKKKKKKSHDYENPPDEINFESHRGIKMESDETESFSPVVHSEESSKKKKKKKKRHDIADYENLDEVCSDQQKSDNVELGAVETLSSELHTEESFRKKKKKKKRHSSEEETEEPAFSDVTFLGKHSKKHKKHSIE